MFLRINSSVPHISQPFASFHNHCVPLSLLFSVSACACVLACSHVCIYNIHACRCTGVSVYDRGKLPVDFSIHVVEAESLLLILLMHRVPQASCPLSFWPIFSYLRHLFCQRSVGMAAVSRHIWAPEAAQTQAFSLSWQTLYPPCHLLTHNQALLVQRVKQKRCGCPGGSSVFILG